MPPRARRRATSLFCAQCGLAAATAMNVSEQWVSVRCTACGEAWGFPERRAFQRTERAMRFPLPDHGSQESPSAHGPTDALVVWTDTGGVILEATAGTAALLGVSRHGLLGRGMDVFVTANRAHVLRAVERAGRGHDDTLDVELHPRGRRSVRVRMHLQFVTQLEWGSVVRWVLRPCDPTWD
jgi:PAS domain-containing protein